MSHDGVNDQTGHSAELLKTFADFNYWANSRLAEWLSHVPDSLLHLEIESSFPSLYLTVLHLWYAETGWLRSLKGEERGHFPGNIFEGDAAMLFEGFLATSRAFREYVHQLSDIEAANPISADAPGVSRSHVILHVVNHSSYHRGQLITMGRQAGLMEIPRTDYIYYLKQLAAGS